MLNDEDYRELMKMQDSDNQFFEMIINRIYSGILQKGDTSLDGGANNGLHTGPMSELVGHQGKVFAIEPIPQLAQNLGRHLANRGVKNVTVIQRALYHEHKAIGFNVIQNDLARSGIERMWYPFEPQIERIDVETISLDEILKSEASWRFCKLDLEGAEFRALQGGRQSIARCSPFMVFENSTVRAAMSYHYSSEDFFGFFHDLGYKVFDLFGRPFGVKEWSMSGLPWYSLAVKLDSEDEYFVDSEVGSILSSLLAAGDLSKKRLMKLQESVDYTELRVRLGETVSTVVPEDCTLVVVTQGDENLLAMPVRQAWHFPQSAEGPCGGAHPVDSAEAIIQLESLQAKGADFLLFPRSAFWWLDRYEEFGRYLDAKYRRVYVDDYCIIYALHDSEVHHTSGEMSVASTKGVGHTHKLLLALSQLSDEEWLEVTIRSIREPTFAGLELPRIPPEEFQMRHDGIAAESLLRLSFNFYCIIKKYMARCGGRLTSESRVLDFGCGWGRLTRMFLKDVLGSNLCGMDMSASAIDLCRQTMSYGSFEVSTTTPPTDFESASFDVICAYSVFSHLSETAHIQWIKEFARILKSGGVLVVTTLGRSFIGSCQSCREQERLEQAWQKAAAESFIDAASALADYDCGKFLFSPKPSEVFGMSLIPRAYVEREWTRFFEFREFIDDRTLLPQALIVMQKPQI